MGIEEATYVSYIVERLLRQCVEETKPEQEKSIIIY